MTAEEMIKVLQQWVILVGVIGTVVVSIIGAIKTNKAVQALGDVFHRLALQDSALAVTAKKVDDYHGAVNGALTAATEAARLGSEHILKDQITKSADATAAALLIADLQKRLAVAEQMVNNVAVKSPAPAPEPKL